MWIWSKADHSLVGFGLVRIFVLDILKYLEHIHLPRLCFLKFILFLKCSCTSSQNFNMMLPKGDRVCMRLSAQMSLLYPQQTVITLGILLPMWDSVVGRLQGYIVISYSSCSTEQEKSDVVICSPGKRCCRNSMEEVTTRFSWEGTGTVLSGRV